MSAAKQQYLSHVSRTLDVTESAGGVDGVLRDRKRMVVQVRLCETSPWVLSECGVGLGDRPSTMLVNSPRLTERRLLRIRANIPYKSAKRGSLEPTEPGKAKVPDSTAHNGEEARSKDVT